MFLLKKLYSSLHGFFKRHYRKIQYFIKLFYSVFGDKKHPQSPHSDADNFLYQRRGPWPQPAPAHPTKCAPEVLHIPKSECKKWDEDIGLRYAITIGASFLYAKEYARKVKDWRGVSDDRFNELLFTTLFTRFLRSLSTEEQQQLESDIARDKPQSFAIDPNKTYGKYDFMAMRLVQPLQDLYCAGTKVIYEEQIENGKVVARQAVQILIEEAKTEKLIAIYPEDDSWEIAKIYALQGAAYHILFVVHPALHFPMDSVNAITKTAVPIHNPLFQLLYPHTHYALRLNNAVLEGAGSVVNNDAKDTRWDPLTANGDNLKLLFGAGYTGLTDAIYTNGYPTYDYLNPVMGFDSDYGRYLSDYYEKAILPFCNTVADHLKDHPEHMKYVHRWADYNSTYIPGFPNAERISTDDILAKALAAFVWTCSVGHGADHDNFGTFITPEEKCLRIRRPPPTHRNETKVHAGEIFTEKDMQRAVICNEAFFAPYTITPNLIDTEYAFTDPNLIQAARQFHEDLIAVDNHWKGSIFMPLIPRAAPKEKERNPYDVSSSTPYLRSLPQSIQF